MKTTMDESYKEDPIITEILDIIKTNEYPGMKIGVTVEKTNGQYHLTLDTDYPTFEDIVSDIEQIGIVCLDIYNPSIEKGYLWV